jgi:hypothetical protein
VLLAAIYLVSPLDFLAIAVFLIVGVIGDAALVTWLFGALVDETERFLRWEARNARGQVDAGGQPSLRLGPPTDERRLEVDWVVRHGTRAHRCRFPVPPPWDRESCSGRTMVESGAPSRFSAGSRSPGRDRYSTFTSVAGGAAAPRAPAMAY